MRLKSLILTLTAAFLIPCPLFLTAAHAQDTRSVYEPVFPTVCTQLTALLSISDGEPSSETSFDTSRIQSALNACTSGDAVELSASGSNYAFLTKPLVLPTGVTLLLDPGVTLFASRNPADYQAGTPNGTTQQYCGQVGNGNPNGCNPLFISYKTTGSGVMGYGVVDGRGADTLLDSSGNPLPFPTTGTYTDYSTYCTSYTWYCLTADHLHHTGSHQNSPMLLNPSRTSSFTLYKTSFIHAPYFHMRWAGPGNGLTVWGVKLITSASEINTDGIDPVDGIANVTITNSYISTGDDNVALSANSVGDAVSDVTLSYNYFYAGTGFAIGTGLQGGVSNVLAKNMYINGNISGGTPTGGEAAIHIKGDLSMGGSASNITYNGFCIQNMRYGIMFNPADSGSGTSIPSFTNITVENVHVLTGEGSINTLAQVQGYDSSHITTASFDNVIYETAPAGDPPATYDTITYGPDPVSPWISGLQGTGVSVSGTTGGTAQPFTCSSSSFPTLIGEFFFSNSTLTNQKTQTLTYSSTSTYTLNALLQPPTNESAALSNSIAFYDSLNGSVPFGYAYLGADGANDTYAHLTVTGASVGTHTYSASYQDSNYAKFFWGDVTVTVNPAPTTNTLTVSPSSITVGSKPTLTATLTSTGGTPTGTVTFYSNGSAIGTGTLSGGVAILNTYAFNTAGTFSITAGFAAQGNYAASTSSAQNLTVH